jgi:hypothetical protein
VPSVPSRLPLIIAEHAKNFFCIGRQRRIHTLFQKGYNFVRRDERRDQAGRHGDEMGLVKKSAGGLDVVIEDIHIVFRYLQSFSMSPR